jgi:hypothetical protein
MDWLLGSIIFLKTDTPQEIHILVNPINQEFIQVGVDFGSYVGKKIFFCSNFPTYICGMKQEIPYTKTSESIIGYSESELAKNETNDCVVRSFASAFEIPYDDAHKFVTQKFNRKEKQGVKFFNLRMDQMINRGETLNNRKFQKLSLDILRSLSKSNNVTFNQFFKRHQTGIYIIIVRGHAFTLKNGVVVGNVSDSKRLKARVQVVYQVN